MPKIKQKILIVDDERYNLTVLGDLLQDDYELSIAKCGSQALNLINTGRPPDMVLLDVMMPDMSGYEVCKQIKLNPITGNIPVIFISAMNTETDETMGFEVGGVDYITKPFRPVVVKARIKTHMELKEHREQLEAMSNIDGLTGIPNRRRFDEYLQQLWIHTINSSNPIALIMMDIDFFKAFNDHYGHIAGDECLKSVAQSLVSVPLRSLDLVARYGGEEFIAVLPQTDPAGSIIIANSMHKAVLSLQIPHACSAISKYVSISVGISNTIHTKSSSTKKLLESADESLYRAKNAGRNRVDTNF